MPLMPMVRNCLSKCDEACIVHGQHSGGLVFFHQFAVGILVFVDFGDFGGKVAPRLAPCRFMLMVMTLIEPVATPPAPRCS